jgi:hypothetical protein
MCPQATTTALARRPRDAGKYRPQRQPASLTAPSAGARTNAPPDRDATRYDRTERSPSARYDSARSTFFVSYVSRTSPSFTSWKLASTMPHSKPVATSRASSLKRLSESIVVS